MYHDYYQVFIRQKSKFNYRKIVDLYHLKVNMPNLVKTLMTQIVDILY